jgi:hypothetical protein
MLSMASWFEIEPKHSDSTFLARRKLLIGLNGKIVRSWVQEVTQHHLCEMEVAFYSQ